MYVEFEAIRAGGHAEIECGDRVFGPQRAPPAVRKHQRTRRIEESHGR